jgi:hypothetical protein
MGQYAALAYMIGAIRYQQGIAKIVPATALSTAYTPYLHRCAVLFWLAATAPAWLLAYSCTACDESSKAGRSYVCVSAWPTGGEGVSSASSRLQPVAVSAAWPT